ncbi:MAG: ABC transporter family substrate-binding protein, partial [Kutzneria sp.]|nr:ABC transporter family substrate-binding protein [Kutzneria sp.]
AFQVLNTAGYASISDISRGEDDYAFTVTYSPKLAEWANLFSVLYPKSMTSDTGQFNSGWRDGPRVTGGPFKIGKLDQTAKTVTVVRDPAWWGARAKLDQIVFKYYSATQVEVDGLASGAFDFAGVSADIDAYKRTSTMPGVALRRANLPNYRILVFNGANSSILSDSRLRTAIMKGVNRSAITKAEVGQLLPDARPVNNHLYMVGFPGYQDNAAGFGFDPDTARNELDALGWKLDGAFRFENGKELTIRDAISSGTKASLDEAKLVQQQLADIGVNVQITQFDPDTFFDQHITPGDFDIAHYAQMGDLAPPVNNAQTYFMVGAQAQQNFGRIGSQQINDLLNQAAAELDLAKRQQLMNEADKRIWALGHSLPLYQRPSIVATRGNLANMGNVGLASYRYADMGWVRQ